MRTVITGGSRGIGRAIALYFASKGHDLAVCARNESDLKKVEAEIREVTPDIDLLTVKCDISDKTSLRSFADFIIEKWGNVDVLINNAGQYRQGNLLDEPDGTLEYLLKVNLESAYYLTRWLLPIMPTHTKSHIFNIGSVAGIQAFKRCGTYTITKFALNGFSKTLREELKPLGIRVTSVLPGAVDTDSWSGEEGFQKEKFMPAEDIASVIYEILILSEKTVVEEIVMRPMEGDV